jgi:CRISPR-associated protein Cas1
VKNYYILSGGRIRREKNTIYVENTDGVKKPIPIEDVESLYLYGEVDLNTRLLNFLSQKRITLHVFNYYGFYSGSYYPREYLHSGFLLVNQVAHYQDSAKRLAVARELVRAAVHSMLRNISYYERRKSSAGGQDDVSEPPGEIDPTANSPTPEETEAAVDSAQAEWLSDSAESAPDDWESVIDFDTDAPQLSDLRATISGLGGLIDRQQDVSALMGIEGKVRERYYRCWQHIVKSDWTFDRRVRRPPDNEINALISFGNSVVHGLSRRALSDSAHPHRILPPRARRTPFLAGSRLVRNLQAIDRRPRHLERVIPLIEPD